MTTHSVCSCESATIIPLSPAMQLSDGEYAKVELYALKFNVSMEVVLEAILKVGLRKIKRLG
jgi:hypothetical protein